MAETAQTLWGLIEPWLAAERLELDDLELRGSGRGRVLRVVVDADQGIDVDRLAEISGGLSRLLDTQSDLHGPYQLEVTSPGLERRLKRHRHYEKSVGREVVVKVRAGEGSRVVKGVLVSADPSRFVVEADGEQQSFGYDEVVVTARTVFRWERAPKPGSKRR